MVSEQFSEDGSTNNDPSHELEAQIDKLLIDTAMILPGWHKVYATTLADIEDRGPVDIQMVLTTNHSARAGMTLAHTSRDGGKAIFEVGYGTDPSADIPEARVLGPTPGHKSRLCSVLKSMLQSEVLPPQVADVVKTSNLLDSRDAKVLMPDFEAMICDLPEWCLAAGATAGYDCQGGGMLEEYSLRVVGLIGSHALATSTICAAYCRTSEWVYGQAKMGDVVRRGIMRTDDPALRAGRELSQAALAGLSLPDAARVRGALEKINLELAFAA